MWRGKGKFCPFPLLRIFSVSGALFSRGTEPLVLRERQMTPARVGRALFSLDYFAAV